VSDYLERKKAEGAAQAISAELKQVFDTSATGLTRCSRDMRYVSANPAYAQIAGVPLGQIIGRPISEVMGEEAFELIRPYAERVLQGERVEYEVELPWTAHGPTWNHVVYVPCQERDGTISGWVAWVSDIAERMRAEAALRELNEDLEEKVEERTRAFDADRRVLDPLAAAGKSAVIPPRPNRVAPREFDRELYKERHLIENFFCKLKQFRAIATRYDKPPGNSLPPSTSLPLRFGSIDDMP
jgi:PAS domain S-box-containing protein